MGKVDGPFGRIGGRVSGLPIIGGGQPTPVPLDLNGREITPGMEIGLLQPLVVRGIVQKITPVRHPNAPAGLLEVTLSVSVQIHTPAGQQGPFLVSRSVPELIAAGVLQEQAAPPAVEVPEGEQVPE